MSRCPTCGRGESNAAVWAVVIAATLLVGLLMLGTAFLLVGGARLKPAHASVGAGPTAPAGR